jgi:anti-sigma B factor antagonist
MRHVWFVFSPPSLLRPREAFQKNNWLALESDPRSSKGDALAFSARTRQLGEVTIVDVRGRFTLIEGEAVHDLLADLFRDGRKRLLLNFRDVSYLDSSGVGQLIRSLYTARKNGAVLKAVELSPRALEVLRLTNLHTIFPDYANEPDALRSFSS